MNNKRLLNTKALVGASLLTAISIVLTRVFSIMVPLGGLPALRIEFGPIPLIISGILYGPFWGGLAGIIADLIGVMINPMGAFFPGFTISSMLWGAIPGVLNLLVKRNKLRINYNIINGAVLTMIATGIVFVLFDNKVIAVKDGAYFIYDKPMSIIYPILYILVVGFFIAIPFFMTRKKETRDNVYSIDKIAFMISVSYIVISLGLNTLWLSIMFNKGVIAFLPGRILAAIVMIPLHTTIIYTLSKSFKYIKAR
ncbi:hypothetical protein DW1_1616 [Proteiniborus sp. DW1]|uniref:folate family ECF transporter S component n=1 Tax=Proteiniborus sp. DW1 TaxID=1889883 RepID=UPI00092E1A82|nr:folate family ECF transporter S component [Proteiniborus sp. DW1]SCG83186.1 hypothetical protein DW1_1616 [Proteiniborus sp. DW1]